MQKVFQQLKDIVPVVTAHNIGEKFVFLSGDDTSTAITQFAYGKLLPGEICPLHKHATMEECFYFITGTGEYLIKDITYKLTPGTFIRIPSNTEHLLKAYDGEPLTYIYFGVAV